ncbi:MAG: inositol monophosphatase [Planctomycetes bacterium]|nr:inositol monophosphatase [Planctomycetota bacterium]
MDVCQTAARAAGQILLDHLGHVSVRLKGPGDLVTEADFAAQQAIRQIVASNFPDHGFVGEEGGADGSVGFQPVFGAAKHGLEAHATGEAAHATSPYVWYVDPLDGTTNFVHGLRHFAVSIGIARQGELVCGVVYDPNTDECFAALRGGGATLNRQPLRTSATTDLGDALIAVSLPVHAQRGERHLEQVLDVIGVCQSVRRMGSAALNLCYLAAGRLDAYWDTKTQIWDVAAGVLIAQEAGGVVTGLDGSPFRVDRPAVVAAGNAILHRELLGILLR